MTDATHISNAELQRLRDVVGRVVNALSDRSIKVFQRGSRAYVQYDPNTGKPSYVSLPEIPDNCDRQLLVAIQGFLDHEVAHLLFTDFEYSRSRLPDVKKSKTLRALSNILEDVRIERAMQKKFPGSISNLGQTRDFVIDKVLRPDIEKMKAEGAVDQAAAMALLLPAAFRALDGQKEMVKFMEDHWDVFGPYEEQLRKFIPQIKALSSTKDVFALSEEIERVIASESESSPGDDGDDDESSESKSKSGKPNGKPQKSSGADGDADDGDSSNGSGSGGKGQKGKKGKKDEKDEKDGTGESKDEGEDKEPDEESGSKGGKDGGEDEGDGEDENESGGDGEDDADDASDGSDEGSSGGGAGGHTSEESGGNEENEFGQGPNKGSDFSKEPVWPEIDPDAVEDLNDMATRAISDEIKRLMTQDGDAPYTPYTRDFDYIGPLPNFDIRHNPALVDLEWYQLAQTNSHVIQSEIQRIFRAKSASRWQPGLRKGRINPHALHRLRTEDSRIFRKREEAQSKSVAVSLVLDLSGSMNYGGKAGGACAAALMFANILDKLGIANEVVGFTTMNSKVAQVLGRSKDLAKLQEDYSKDLVEIQAAAQKLYNDWARNGGEGPPPDLYGGRYARMAPTCLYAFKEFRERFTDDHRKVIAMIPKYYMNYIACNNVDGESIAQAAFRLVQRKENRKIMIVMSDGSPCADGDTGQLCRHLQSTVKELTAAGIEMLGLGMLDRSVTHYYPKSVVVNDAAEIPQAILQLLQLLLL